MEAYRTNAKLLLASLFLCFSQLDLLRHLVFGRCGAHLLPALLPTLASRGFTRPTLVAAEGEAGREATPPPPPDALGPSLEAVREAIEAALQGCFPCTVAAFGSAVLEPNPHDISDLDLCILLDQASSEPLPEVHYTESSPVLESAAACLQQSSIEEGFMLGQYQIQAVRVIASARVPVLKLDLAEPSGEPSGLLQVDVVVNNFPSLLNSALQRRALRASGPLRALCRSLRAWTRGRCLSGGAGLLEQRVRHFPDACAVCLHPLRRGRRSAERVRLASYGYGIPHGHSALLPMAQPPRPCNRASASPALPCARYRPSSCGSRRTPRYSRDGRTQHGNGGSVACQEKARQRQPRATH